MPEKAKTDQAEDKCSIIATYQSYLLRIWKDGAEALWRASAQSIQTGEVVRFASLTELFAYLEVQTNDQQQDKEAQRQ